MRLEIDQSGKVEKTNQPTVIGISNKDSITIILPKKEKQKLQKIFRELGRPKLFVLKVFAALTVIALKYFPGRIDEIVIDEEYTGYDHLLIEIITSYLSKIGGNISPSIYIKRIGKQSNAHRIAILSFRKRQASKVIDAKELLKILI